MNILIGIPTYDRRMDIDIVRGIIDLERHDEHNFDYIFPVSSHLCRNRNYIVKQFLSGNYDALLFWDSDIGLDNGFIDRMFKTAYNMGARVVCGAYLKKQEKEEYVIGRKKGEKYENFKPEKAQEIDAGGTGCMLIYREVLEKMADPWFTILDKPNLEVMPEDYLFCEKAKELGFKIAVEPGFSTKHWGNFAYTHKS